MNLHIVWRVSAIGVIWLLLNSNGFASMITSRLTVMQGHQSSLRARVTMVDGTSRSITIQGVGCTDRICSRVRATTVMADSLWLDELASVRTLSHNATGPVSTVFTLKNGVERHESIAQLNRVLYVDGRFGRTEKLDLSSLARVDFE